MFLDINIDDYPPLLTDNLPWSELNPDAATSTTKAERFNVGDTESEWDGLVLGLEEPWTAWILILNDFSCAAWDPLQQPLMSQYSIRYVIFHHKLLNHMEAYVH